MMNPLRRLFDRKQKHIHGKDFGKPTTDCAMKAKNGIIKRFTEYIRA
jgi:hypothetical protein